MYCLEWHKETFNQHMLNFEEVSKDELAEKLRKFYCEATPKPAEQRTKTLPQHQVNEYYRNTMTNIRSAINRHLKDLDRRFDIVGNNICLKINVYVYKKCRLYLHHF